MTGGTLNHRKCPISNGYGSAMFLIYPHIYIESYIKEEYSELDLAIQD
jgi:hypothetical protein